MMSGPASAQDICLHLKISQPTFSRLAASLTGQIFRAGKGSQTQYAWKAERPEITVYTIDEAGSSGRIALLHPLPRGFYLESNTETVVSRFFKNLPYLFEDLRPNGFLGRLVPRQYPELNLPDDVDRWNDGQCLEYLTRHGWDLIGNFILGENAFEEYLANILNPRDAVDEGERSSKYPLLADRMMSTGVPGTSAGGEQPKFLARRNPGATPVLVKFSPPIKDDLSRRIADLLVCEHIAHDVVRDYGKASAKSSLVEGEGRLFLETERFDRVGQKGRKGLLSLKAVDLEFVGKLDTWSETAKALREQKKIDDSVYRDVVWLETFGRLIGNTDMHHGNLSFFADGEKLLGLAPVYDMLPMLYAPQQGQLVQRPFEPKPPKAAEFSIWAEAVAAARDFWKRIGSQERISSDFKTLTAKNEGKISKLETLVGLLPSSRKHG